MKEIVKILSRWSAPASPPPEPALLSDIEALEAEADNTLPGAYHAFLEAMGCSLGSLRIAQGEFSIDRIIEWYQITDCRPPSHLLCIGLDFSPFGESRRFVLDRNRPCGKDDCAVLRVPVPPDEQWSRDVTVDFVSLREMLIYWAFKSLRAPRLHHHATLGWSPASAKSAHAVGQHVIWAVEQLGLTLMPHMSVCRIFDGEQVTIAISRDAVTGDLQTVEVAALDAHECKNRVAQLEDLGLERRIVR